MATAILTAASTSAKLLVSSRRNAKWIIKLKLFSLDKNSNFNILDRRKRTINRQLDL